MLLWGILTSGTGGTFILSQINTEKLRGSCENNFDGSDHLLVKTKVIVSPCISMVFNTFDRLHHLQSLVQNQTWVSCSKIIRNFKMVTGGRYNKGGVQGTCTGDVSVNPAYF